MNISSFLTAQRARSSLCVPMAAWRRLLLIRKSPFHPQCPCQAALRHGCHHCRPPGTLPPGAVNTAVGGGRGSMLAPHPRIRAARARRCRQRCALLWWCPLWCLKIGACCGVFHASNPVQWNAVGPNSAGCPTARFLAFAVEKNYFRIFWGWWELVVEVIINFCLFLIRAAGIQPVLPDRRSQITLEKKTCVVCWQFY